MIKNLTVEYYQSHKEVELDLHPNVNVIIGESMSGKSALIRALRWLAFNRPTGARYVSNNADKPVCVAVETDRGELVHKYRNKTTVDYNLIFQGDIGEINETYRKFGASVPEPVQNALNLSEMNFQNQLDSPFLIMTSPAKFLAEINKVTKLEDVDNWISDITSQINSDNRELKKAQSTIDRLKPTLKSYNKLDIARQYHDKLERKLIRYEEIRDKQQKLATLLTKWESVHKRIINHFEKVDEVQVLMNLTEALEIELDECNRKLSKLDYYIKADKVLKHKNKELDEILAQIKKEGICPTCGSKLTDEHIKHFKRRDK